MDREYPSIARKIETTRNATMGKRGHQRALKRLRTASLKRENKERGASLRSGEKRGEVRAQ